MGRTVSRFSGADMQRTLKTDLVRDGFYEYHLARTGRRLDEVCPLLEEGEVKVGVPVNLNKVIGNALAYWCINRIPSGSSWGSS